MLNRAIALTLVVLGVALQAVVVDGATAQTPEPSSTAGAEQPTQVPSDPNETLTITATVRLEVNAQGEFQRIPEGTRLQVIVGEGDVCFDYAVPTTAIETLERTKVLQLPPVTIPLRAVNTRCPSEGGPFTIALAYPDGSFTVLLTSGWSPGATTIELVVPAPGPQPSTGQPPGTGQPSSSPGQLPSTGGSDSDSGIRLYAAALILMVGAGALYGLSRVFGRARDSSAD
jgi:hypothetical protein